MWVNGDLCKIRRVQNDIVPSVLTGVYPKEAVNKMNENRLESVVTCLIDSTLGGIAHSGSENSDCKRCAQPDWWPNNLTFDYPVAELRTRAATYSMKWRAILKCLIVACSDFYKADPCLSSLASARCRTYTPRKVLAPTQENKNINTLAMKRKRKRSDDSDCACLVKKPKQLNLKPYSIALRRRPVPDLILENKCLSRSAVVPLRDVFQEIPAKKQQDDTVTKDDFLQYFNLGQKEAMPMEMAFPVKLNFVRLCTVPHIPFSSDVGRIIMKRENQNIPVEVHLRRIDRIEWYLKDLEGTLSCERNYEVTYDEKLDVHYHPYKFPKRQMHQEHKRLQDAFLEYVLRPVYVYVEKLEQSLVSNSITSSTAVAEPVEHNRGKRCSIRIKAVQEKKL